MGGMIAQTMAIEHPGRVRSLTSIMSTTGEAEFGTPHPDCLAGIMSIMAPVEGREARIEQGVELARLIGTPSVFDEARARARSTRTVDRAYDSDGVARQMVAILASGSRADGLRTLELPTVVLHGDVDPLVDVSGGRRTAELVPGARFELMADMGHDLPPSYWDRVVDGITAAVTAVEA
jgi:pimeloyl-ACP methyl ester carboxylesterase